MSLPANLLGCSKPEVGAFEAKRTQSCREAVGLFFVSRVSFHVQWASFYNYDLVAAIQKNAVLGDVQGIFGTVWRLGSRKIAFQVSADKEMVTRK